MILIFLNSFRLSAFQVDIPAPVGMICAGLFLANVPSSGPNQAILIQGLRKSWSNRVKEAALAIIFLRSGLEIDLEVWACRLSMTNEASCNQLQRCL